MKFHTFLLVISTILFLSCEKESNRTTVKSPLYYCCNFYEIEECDKEDRIKQIQCFFRKNDIRITQPEIIDEGSAVFCNFCCQCPNGEYLLFDIKNEDLEAVLELGISIE